MTADQLTNAQALYTKLLTKQQSILLATVSIDGSPLVSYAPFLQDAEQNFFVFVSALAPHTTNLIHSGQASLMLIADETNSAQIFARERVTFQCLATPVARDSASWHAAVTLYEARFGHFFRFLCGLSDFHMVRLTPNHGTLMAGFGQAYVIEGPQLDELVSWRA